MKLTALLILSVTIPLSCEGQSLSQCFQDAANTYGVPQALLLSVASQESKMNPAAVHNNGQSMDVGIMQINTGWLKRSPFIGMRYKPEDLTDGCTNVKVGAWILAGLLRDYPLWDAVGRYNASCRTLTRNQCQAIRSAYEQGVYRKWWHLMKVSQR